MSMIYPHPVLDPNAQAKSMIDAVTGHQPSPLDSEYSSETPTKPKTDNRQEKRQISSDGKRVVTRAGKQVAGDFANCAPQASCSHAL
jgi:hypothetical protein